MGKIVLDCDLMRFPNSGLYYYCLNLGVNVNQLLDEQGGERMQFYVPPQEKDTFQGRGKAIVEKPWHQFVKPFLWNCRIWHAPFQSGRMIPKRGGRTKIVLTIHDLNPLHEGKPRGEQRKALAYTQSLVDSSDVIVCISEFCKSDVLSNLKVRDQDLYVIHNGTHGLHEPQLLATSYRPSLPFLFAIGYVNRKKNFHTLLPLLENSEVELVVAGRLDEPDYIASMEEDARRRGVADRLHILGPVSDGEKAWYLENCTAYMHPSLAEGFGATVVEAMNFGRPLFLSNLTSLPEIAGDVAFYFRSFDGDHMRQVYQAGMQYYGRNGLAQRIVEKGKIYNWREKAAQYLQMYQSLM
ncbi:MAG TPA: glycosyltransferase family 1 protein [Chitinophagaceae bacterium]